MKINLSDFEKTYWKKIPVSLIRDKRLSYEARGVAVHLMSMAERWNFIATKLPAVLEDCTRAKGSYGRDLTQRIIKEFEECGYLSRQRIRASNGRWQWLATFNPLAGVQFLSDELIGKRESVGSSNDGKAVDGKAVDDQGGNKSRINKASINKETLHKFSEEKNEGETGSVGSLKIVTMIPPNCDFKIDLSHPLLRNHVKTFELISKKFIERVPVEIHQQVADELAGTISAATYGNHLEIKSVRAWLIAVFRAVERDEFVQEFGHTIEKNRKTERTLQDEKSSSGKLVKDEFLHSTNERPSETCVANARRILSEIKI